MSITTKRPTEAFAAMYDPPHPGEILRDMYLAPLGLKVTNAAEWFGISRQSLSELLNGHNGLSPEMAIRLSKAFPNTTVRFWLGLQLQYDAWRAEQRAPSIELGRMPVS